MVIELSGVQFSLKSYVECASTIWFQTKTARPQVQLPLFYSHFEITEFSQYQTIIYLT